MQIISPVNFLLRLALKYTQSADVMYFRVFFYLFPPHTHTQSDIVECGLVV